MADIPDGMLPDTFEYLIRFTAAHEGRTNFMYNNWPWKNPAKDVTVGIGIAVRNETQAAGTPIRSLFTVKVTRKPASEDDMRREFRRVLDLPRTADNLWTDYRDASPLTMDMQTMEGALRDLMLQFWDQRAMEFPNFGAIPAQAQVVLMSYNYGRRLRGAPSMCKAVLAGDYPRAAIECWVNGWDGQKNKAHQVLLLNASALVHQGQDLTKLPPVAGPFKPPPSELDGTSAQSDVQTQLPGRWNVTIGSWSGMFFFDANGGVSWAETAYGQRHAGRWTADDSTIEWRFREPDDIRTFKVSLPLDTTSVAGTILPAGQGWFTMSKP